MSAFVNNPANWTALGVVLILLVIWWKAAPGIVKALDARAAKIKETLDEAAKLREEAQHLLAEYQRKQRDSVKEAEDLIEAAKREADRLAKESAENLSRALERRQQMALEKIARAEAEALREVRELSVDIAVAATRKLIADSLGPDRDAHLVDAAIADVGKRLH
jgi:F-type H+-transporting ATPase subunit b